MDLVKRIRKISTECLKLKDKYVSGKDLKIDWVCIFSQSEKEYRKLTSEAIKIGLLLETTDTGLIYLLNVFIETPAGIPKLLKIRKYDPTRPEMGDVDFTTNYGIFKKTYFDNKRFILIQKDRFEMIELKDSDFKARVYFSSIPPSKLRGIS